MEPLSVGPFVIPGFVVHAAVALLPAYLVALVWMRRDRDARGSLVDLLSTALLIYVFLWKLGPLLSSPGLVLEEPRLLLIGRGGAAGIAAGAVGAGAYLAVTIIRRRLYATRVISGLAVFAVLLAGIYGVVALAAAPTLPGAAAAGGTGGDGGRPAAPEFTLDRLDGERFSLAGARGRPVVLNFWATWCGPCRIETPVKKRLHEELGEGGLIVGVNLTTSEGSVGDVQRYVEELDIEYPVVLDSTGRVQQLYGVRGTPTTYIIDPDGRVVHRFMGAMSFGDMMRRLEPLM